MDNSYLLNAVCGWLDELGRKHKRSVVISCSFGGFSGGFDGNDVEQRQLSARFGPDARGRALCVSAGNEGYEPIHTEQLLAARGEVELLWKAPGPNHCQVKLLFDTFAGI